MIRKNNLLTLPALLILIMPIIIMSSGCRQANEEFAIYLTENSVSPSQMPALSQVKLASQPLIDINDIVTYDAKTHEIVLTENAYQRILHLQVPTSGTSFVVCAGGKPIYDGAFWTPISSQSYSGIIIEKPLASNDVHSIQISPGYPAFSFFQGEDRRNDPTIMNALEKAGKLINNEK